MRRPAPEVAPIDREQDAAQSDDKTEEMAREIYMRSCARVGHLMLAFPPRAAGRMALNAVLAAQVFDRVREQYRRQPSR